MQSAQAANFSALKMTGSAQVAQVISPQLIQLHDGRLVHLAGLDMPYLDVRGKDGYTSPLPLLAVNILKDLLEGERVKIYQARKGDIRINRMGYHVAHIERASDSQWAQGLLLSLGLARVRTSLHQPEMAKQMYSREKQARAEAIGIWEDESYAVMTPEDVMDKRDDFVVIEGKIHGVAMKKNKIYINFGSNWRDDFTVAIPSPARRLFSKAQIDPLQWGHYTIRVRGWLEQYNGPYIEIDHPERIEIVRKANPKAAPVTEEEDSKL